MRLVTRGKHETTQAGRRGQREGEEEDRDRKENQVELKDDKEGRD